MKLGILSDSHGRALRVRQALRQLEAAGAEAFVHCGDIGGPEVIDEFAGKHCYMVWGNTDDRDPTLRSYFETLGLPFPNGPLELNLDGKSVAVFHGHEGAFRRAIQSPRFDYLFYGHTHRRDDRRLGHMRVINPGALHRALTRSVALLDLAQDRLEYIEIVDGRP